MLESLSLRKGTTLTKKMSPSVDATQYGHC